MPIPPSADPPTVPGILQRTAAGDPVAVRECIDRYGGLVWSLARKLLSSDADAQDAVQEVFVELWKHAGRYDPAIASETAFVAMIARRRLIDRRRKSSRGPQRESLEDHAEPIAFASPGPPENAEDIAQAASALLQLSTQQQKVLRLSIYQGLSHEGIARAIGLPLGTVKTHARRGLLKLRALLESPGGGGSARGVAEGEA